MSNENDYKIKLICSPHDGSRNAVFQAMLTWEEAEIGGSVGAFGEGLEARPARLGEADGVAKCDIALSAGLSAAGGSLEGK